MHTTTNSITTNIGMSSSFLATEHVPKNSIWIHTTPLQNDTTQNLTQAPKVLT